jgi:hypothetical protein
MLYSLGVPVFHILFFFTVYMSYNVVFILGLIIPPGFKRPAGIECGSKADPDPILLHTGAGTKLK